MIDFEDWANRVTPALERHAQACNRNHDPDLASEAAQRTLLTLWRDWRRIGSIDEEHRIRLAYAANRSICRAVYAQACSQSFRPLEEAEQRVAIDTECALCMRIDVGKAIARLPRLLREYAEERMKGSTNGEIQAARRWWYGRANYVSGYALRRLGAALGDYRA